MFSCLIFLSQASTGILPTYTDHHKRLGCRDWRAQQQHPPLHRKGEAALRSGARRQSSWRARRRCGPWPAGERDAPQYDGGPAGRARSRGAGREERGPSAAHAEDPKPGAGRQPPPCGEPRPPRHARGGAHHHPPAGGASVGRRGGRRGRRVSCGNLRLMALLVRGRCVEWLMLRIRRGIGGRWRWQK